jgi:uncharacterized protein
VKFLALTLIRFYQTTISPTLPSSCRFYPTCSAYAREAVERWGVWKGGALTLRRLLRCRPFGGQGYDPVPEKEVLGARGWVPSRGSPVEEEVSGSSVS